MTLSTDALLTAHAAWAGCPVAAVVAVASPGRVNLIGEHTDYNGGHVLPTALDVDVTALLSPRADGQLRARSLDLGDEAQAALGPNPPASAPEWCRYPLGAAALLREGGVAVGGFDLTIRSTVPIGAGLSSSAALDVAVLEGLLVLHGTALPPVAVARLAQQIEVRFAGVRCGLMDPYVSRLGRQGHALYLDCARETHEEVPLTADLAIVLFNSGVKHALASSAYNTRRAECGAALEAARSRWPGTPHLAALVDEPLDDVLATMDAAVRPRARHVLTEERRTRAAVTALRSGDLATLGAAMAESHRSLRVDYEVTCPELDGLVEAAAAHPACVGARMTGGGFGGSTVNLVRPEAVAEFVAAVQAAFARRFGYVPTARRHESAAGTRRLA